MGKTNEGQGEKQDRACLQITWTKFRSDLGQIWLWRSAQNRRRSSATLRILRLSRDQRWPEDEMQYVHVICEQALILLRHILHFNLSTSESAALKFGA